ncbi:putative glutamate receptor isoform X2 [Oratosquilla oratoria]|uniref:putative glutamate receptor isoform X2 n=1 Tax=Oratosquilla oratoria TaxID=337810 RepID=UPI003F769C81
MCDSWTNVRNEGIINFIVTVPRPIFWSSIATDKRSSLQNIQSDCIKVCKGVKQSQKLTALLKQHQQQSPQGQQQTLKLPVKTRWGSIIQWLKSVCNNKHALQALAINDDAKPSLDLSIRKLLPSEVFWDQTEGILKLLKPVADAITATEGDNKNLSLVMKVYSDLKLSFEENLSSSQILKSEEYAFKGIIRERKFLVKSIHLAANLVDPCYCGCHLSGEEAYPPFMDLTPDGKWFGIMIDIVDIIADKFNTCYVWNNDHNTLLGVELPNGSWTGNMGLVQRKEVAIAPGPIGLNYDRSRVADFSEPLYILDHRIVYKRPRIEPDLAGFVKPYTTAVWVGIAVMTLLTILTLHFLSIFSAQNGWPSSFQRGKHQLYGGTTSWMSSLIEIISWCFGNLTGQSLAWLPSGLSGHVLGVVWLLACLVINQVYKGILKSMLILPRDNIPFDNLEELTSQDEYGWKFLEDSVLYLTWKDAPPESIPGQVISGRAGFVIPDFDLAFVEIEDNGYAFLLDSITIKSLLHMRFSHIGQCTMAVISQGFLQQNMLGMAYPKDSPFRERADHIIYSLREFGLLEQWLQQSLTNSSKCYNQPNSIISSSTPRPLAIQDLIGVLLLYVAGMLFSMLVFVFELAGGALSRSPSHGKQMQPKISQSPIY